MLTTTFLLLFFYLIWLYQNTVLFYIDWVHVSFKRDDSNLLENYSLYFIYQNVFEILKFYIYQLYFLISDK